MATNKATAILGEPLSDEAIGLETKLQVIVRWIFSPLESLDDALFWHERLPDEDGEVCRDQCCR